MYLPKTQTMVYLVTFGVLYRLNCRYIQNTSHTWSCFQITLDCRLIDFAFRCVRGVLLWFSWVCLVGNVLRIKPGLIIIKPPLDLAEYVLNFFQASNKQIQDFEKLFALRQSSIAGWNSPPFPWEIHLHSWWIFHVRLLEGTCDDEKAHPLVISAWKSRIKT